jgi:thimet oligopeptidase
MRQIRALTVVVLASACGGSTPSPVEPAPEPVAPAPAPGKADEAVAPPTADSLFLSSCKDRLAELTEAKKALASVAGARTTANTLVPMNDLLTKLSNVREPADLFARVHPDAKMRTAGEECSKLAAQFGTELSLDRTLYDALGSVDVKKEDANTVRFRDRFARDMRLSGVDKDDATRARLTAIDAELADLGLQFDKNINEDTRRVKVPAAALEGLPADYVSAHKPDAAGKVTITTDYPDFFPFRTYSKDPEARKAVFLEYMNRGYPKNKDVLLKILTLRQERAKLLGFATWADYITVDKMIGSGKNVKAFVDKITKVADKRMKADLAELLAIKKKTDAKATNINDEEARFLAEQVRREKYTFDAQSVRPYFDFEKVRDGLLGITARLYDVEFIPTPQVEVWHKSVSVYDVVRRGEKLGTIYLDLHPRDGKYKHAAQFTLQRGVAGVQLPKGVLVCNFSDPSVQKPALMDHDQVEVMFHEFGHLMHEILGGNQKWWTQAGVATEWDFVEAPSQMFEEWAWDPAMLATFAKHVETGEALPAATVAKMRAAREFGKGMDARRQMYLAAMSLETHTRDPKTLDLDALTIELTKKYAPYQYVEGTHLYANFGHLNGYNAMYYTYMWSRVIAKDMFTPFEKAGLGDPATATKYRQRVLEPGGTKDAAQLVADFLGRPYRFDSYQKWLDKK